MIQYEKNRKAKNMIYGYVRVSTISQVEDRQLKALSEIKELEYENIIIEKKSGKNTSERPVFIELLQKMKEGDTLAVTSLDRLGRKTKDILSVYEKLKEKKINLIITSQKMLNIEFSKNEKGELVENTANSFGIVILALLSSLAEMERNTMLERQREAYEAMERDEEGRRISKRTGKPIGKKSLTTVKDIKNLNTITKNLIKGYLFGKYKYNDIKSNLNFGKTTFYKIVNIIRDKGIEL